MDANVPIVEYGCDTLADHYPVGQLSLDEVPYNSSFLVASYTYNKSIFNISSNNSKSIAKGPLNKALIPKLSHLVSYSPRMTFKTNHPANHLI